jgi:hypothetical protein
MHRGAVAHTFRLGLLVACLLAVCACGGGAEPLSEEYGSLSPGRYVADGFQPALSFEVGNGWEVAELQQKPYLEILREYKGGDYFVAISFNNPPPSGQRPQQPQQARARAQRLGLLVPSASPPRNLRAPADERRRRSGEALRHQGFLLARGLLQ